MNLTVITRLKEIGLTTEQMVQVLEMLAVQLAPLDELRRHQAELASLRRERNARYYTAGKTPVSVLQDVLLDTESTKERVSHTLPKENNNLTVVPPVVPHQNRFLQFWEIYPKRAGNRDKAAAEKAFNAACRRATPDEIIAGAQRYAIFCEAAGKIGTEFIRQARTWLNQSSWKEEYDAPRNGRTSGIDTFERQFTQYLEGSGPEGGRGHGDQDSEVLSRSLKGAA